MVFEEPYIMLQTPWLFPSMQFWHIFRNFFFFKSMLTFIFVQVVQMFYVYLWIKAIAKANNSLLFVHCLYSKWLHYFHLDFVNHHHYHHADSTNSLDFLLSSIPISKYSRQRSELMNISFCWLTNTGVSMCKGS